MKTPLALGVALLSLFLVSGAAGRAQTAPAAPAPPTPSRELAVVVVEPLDRPFGALSAFDRLDMAFTAVAKERKWPLKVVTERFAANMATHETELRIFYKGIDVEAPGELTLRAWVTFADPTVKKDFGIVVFHYYPRAIEPHEDIMENIFHGTANAIADKIEPLLFPQIRYAEKLSAFAPNAVSPPPENAVIIEETSLLAQIGAGDRDAFRQLYARYSAPLFSLAIRLVGSTGDAEELLQDAFLKIWRHAAAFDPLQSQPFTWAVTILRRTCIDHLRKRRRLPLTIPLSANAEGAQVDSAGETARPAAEAREDSARLHGALAELPPDRRRALELALFSELTHLEIAARLDQPVGTIKSWIRRGLLDLRTTLTASAS